MTYGETVSEKSIDEQIRAASVVNVARFLERAAVIAEEAYKGRDSFFSFDQELRKDHGAYIAELIRAEAKRILEN
jgi:hypothetical protein